METYHIHINGIVQGVGFRPFIYLLAKQMDIKGYVKNGSAGVHILFNSTEDVAQQFFKKIKLHAPEKSKITSAEIKQAKNNSFNDFSIQLEENLTDSKEVLMSPDSALCNDCRNELHDVSNRRYRYPFITCTRCGPRYSIVNSLPYDRGGTAMQPFSMCEKCEAEYNDVNDRRFFSQTNSCSTCGIKLRIKGNNGVLISNNTTEVLSHIKTLLTEQNIIAIKGVGGYLLLCDAGNAQTIQKLRSRKHRKTKPFAVLYPNVKEVENDFELMPQERELLLSPEAPIVLLWPKKDIESLAINDIAPGLNKVGVMIPSNPLLDLIASDFGKPLIATSANISGSPIIYLDTDAVENLFDIADYIVSDDREIVTPQDDSVMQVSHLTGEKIFLRRSRGYAPSFLSDRSKSNKCILATGAFLKSSFTLNLHGNTFISQYLGSGESYESQQMYKDTLAHWLNLYDARPDVIISDLHPGYFSHQYAQELSEKFEGQLKLIQHHEAHFAAVLAEHNLINADEAVMGIIWDGTGLGHDGNIGGGEFFTYANHEMTRINHFEYFPLIAGDKMAMEPRISALCGAHGCWPTAEILREKFTIAEWNTYRSLIDSAKIYTSSAGRLFDAVASLLGLCDKQSYEGEAAMYLQHLAEEYINKYGFNIDQSYFKKDECYANIPIGSLMQCLIHDINKGLNKAFVAAKFHYSLVCLIDIVAQQSDMQKICFSGGVFQNMLLVDWIKHKCGAKYELYFHKELSPNDENISYGQMVHYKNDIRSASQNSKGSKNASRKYKKEPENIEQ